MSIDNAFSFIRAIGVSSSRPGENKIEYPSRSLQLAKRWSWSKFTVMLAALTPQPRSVRLRYRRHPMGTECFERQTPRWRALHQLWR
jgi:hypothetical protein